jgi:hypothetical protein
MATTVPMLAPDGTSGDIPQDRVQDALKAGFKQAVAMNSPDGKLGYIPVERQQDALSAGFKLAPGAELSGVPGALPGQQSPTQAAGIQKPQLHGTSINYGNVLAIPDVAVGAAKGLGALSNSMNRAVYGDPSASNPMMAPQQLPYGLSAAPASPEAQQAAITPQNPAQKGGYIAEKIGEAVAPIPGAAAVGAPAAEAIAGQVVPSAIKAKAAGLLQSVAHDANQVPVQLNNAGDAALKLMDWQKVTQLGPTVNKFLNRVTNPKLGPLTYEDARDFYQVLGNLSANDAMKIPAPVRRDIVQLVVGLKQDIGDAADTVGRAADYFQGMGDYAKGAKLQQWVDSAKNYATKTAIGAAGASGLYGLYKELTK